MKLCPVCDFIYEDDQMVCDMDGKELVADPASVVTEQNLSPRQNPGADNPPVQLAGNEWRNFVVAAVVVFVLTALVVVAYLARTRQISSGRAPEISEPSTDRSAEQLPSQSTSGDTAQPPSSDVVSTQTPSTDAAVHEQSVEQSAESSTSSEDEEALAHTRLTPGPVSAGASGISRGPVIVWLVNGAAIRADEAWEKQEGVWYRQGSVVSFLPRSQVRTIERLPSPAPRLKSAPTNAEEKSKQTEPAAEPRKESKVSSFFKKTGRILKKPFKF
jgi:hypothetical protein